MAIEDDYDFDDYEGEDNNRLCGACEGTGKDKYSDGLFACPECDGEGYRWWE